ncbi:BolA family protein [Acidomonas methanolica]|uniref:Stress response and cell division protein BolA n=1 Tax=Acidomonas methanolica NBRC 104435 TaxID=1231351 RepID=A0A023D595_ACIMT|nr:BolA family protein [Acidomonas methanolica]MBU2653224.1 BolA family transcriptional regulator [Acidomonas methanolica]MCQ9154557.1 BolA family transcriptional regulator [Acidomonas methanolica]TCS32173.1 BolA protein [Acidomonas methanolica]GAJ28976.1 stress response and cell division protein BolA [Acidomonas methanolica NBRC 104435]GBQ55494.1 stress response and cell division protein BolA [Acidomonas methanolica]
MVSETRAERIGRRLKAEFAPETLEIRDESARHAHHASARELGGAGETHFNIAMASARFKGLSRVQRHRLVHEALADEFAGGLHALSLVLSERA